MFEEYTEEYFVEHARKMGKELGVDTRQGSIYMDAAMGHCMRAAKFYSDLRMTFNMLFLDTCTGEILDAKAAERQVYRKEATPSYYEVSFEGISAADMIGDRFLVRDYYFTLISQDDMYLLRSEVKGSVTNFLVPGLPLIPVRNRPGLNSATLGNLYMDGTDEESDDSLKERYRMSIVRPVENGNQQQYKSWCEGYEGVGRAIIFPLAYGANTVKALIISSDGGTPPEALINKIQEDIDPGSEGLGEGMAFIGCKFYAVAAAAVEINISMNAELLEGYVIGNVADEIKEELRLYFKDIALNTADNENMIIRYVKVVSILTDIKGIRDFSELLINGISGNITIGDDNVGVMGEVDIHVNI